ncbi:MAG: hypothetical protein IJ751_08760 [Oscillospiraceae bacterium]|nr:hypothetical protein [Oscillospiraceae bacterium]
MDRDAHSLRELSSTLREIPGLRGKLGYIWAYYKLWIIGAVCLLCFAGFVVIRATTAVTENWIYAVFVNTYAEVGSGSEFRDGYLALTGYDTKEKNVQFDGTVYFDYAENRGRGNTYYDSFVSFIDAGVLDAATMGRDSLEALGATGRLLDLNDARCAAIREKYGDRLIYAIPLDESYSTELIPVGIDISDSPLVAKYRIYEADCGLCIGANSTHIEAVEQLLDYLFGEGPG